MSKIPFIIGVLLSLYIGYKVNKSLQPPPVPKLPNTWWGQGEPNAEDTSIRPFKIDVSDEVLDDLRFRLNHTRPFTPPLSGTQHQYGINTNLLREVVDYWLHQYDWRTREKHLNQYPQFITNIQGLDIHYIHVKPSIAASSRTKVLPLLLLHGWPGSVVEFYEIIPLLTQVQRADQRFVFEVFAPSLPGYGFSQAAVRPGLGSSQMAVVFRNFMRRVGFERYYVQAGDFGAVIGQNMAVLFPEAVLGLHSNFCWIMETPKVYVKLLLGLLYPGYVVRKDHYDRVYPLLENFGNKLAENGYMHLQATKPDTIGVAMRDSPVGLAAYILEKFITGTDRSKRNVEDGGLKIWYTYDALLDNIMIYWVTGSMPTAFRLYAETLSIAHRQLGTASLPVTVPSACARFKNDFYSPDGIIRDTYVNLVHLNDYDEGHFAAFQVPKVLAKDVFLAVEKFEELNST